jgi:hypothetical protein
LVGKRVWRRASITDVAHASVLAVLIAERVPLRNELPFFVQPA